MVLNKKDLYFLTLHLKLSSLFYPLQLVDLFIYETPASNNLSNDFKSKSTNGNDRSVIVYNFQVLSTQQRFFIFVLNSINSTKKTPNNIKLKSITNLFLNANWLEREASELNGVYFYGKKDLRNLMLQYGDNSSPFKKTSPCVGSRELFYDSVNDLLIQTPTTIQF